jgi:serine/threonine-protein kinase
MASELEEVLAIETSRAGQATGEVTSVLRTLPGGTRRRLPWRLRHPVRWIAVFAAIGAIVALALVLAAGHTHRGTGVASGAGAAGLRAVGLSQTAAHGYNPFGTGPENRDRIQNVVDSDPNTSWSTEQYYGGTLQKPGGVGTGLYIDASPGVIAKAIEIDTTTPGFAVQVYAAGSEPPSLPYGDSTPLVARGWRGPFGASSSVAGRQRIRLGVSRPFRYYLLWLTTLPAGRQSASISGITLYR